MLMLVLPFPSALGVDTLLALNRVPQLPRPSKVPFSSGVDSSCIPLLAADANAPHGDHGRASVGFPPGKSFVDDWSESSSLVHYPDFDYATSCHMMDADLGNNKDLWKLCIIGYVARKFLGFTALNNLISSSWNCNAKLTIHDSGWLIYTSSLKLTRLSFSVVALSLFLAGLWS
jgi:hypothetical protein